MPGTACSRSVYSNYPEVRERRRTRRLNLSEDLLLWLIISLGDPKKKKKIGGRRMSKLPPPGV